MHLHELQEIMKLATGSGISMSEASDKMRRVMSIFYSEGAQFISDDQTQFNQPEEYERTILSH